MKPVINVVACLLAALLCLVAPARADKITVAAASDLKYAMDEIADGFRKAHPADQVEVVYGSSGKFFAQIRNGAPYDLFFSADVAYPRELAQLGHAAAPVRSYALGRIALWSAVMDATRMTLDSLTDPAITRIAIANPRHAPYGKRAEEALRAAGLWDKVAHKLVNGESVSHATHFVQTGNAQVGMIALSLALGPDLASKGGYWLIPDTLHQPLEQGYVITRRAGNSALAKRFADYVEGPQARAVMRRYGFILPGEDAAR